MSKTPVGYVENIKITLERAEPGNGIYAIHLLVENEGTSERSITLFGAGASRNGGSLIIVRDREFSAGGIEFGDVARRELAEQTVIPGVPLRAKVHFAGLQVPPGKIAVFELAHSDSDEDTRPDGRVTFRFNAP